MAALLSFSDEVALLGPGALVRCPALAQAAYQLAFRSGPFHDVVSCAVRFTSSLSLKDLSETTSSVAEILSCVSSAWATSSASDAFMPPWKVSAGGEALLPPDSDQLSSYGDVPLLSGDHHQIAAITNFAVTRRKMVRGLVGRTAADTLSEGLRQVLRCGGLVDSNDQLTGAGLQFCMSHPYRQAWLLTAACLRRMEGRGVSKNRVLEMCAVLFHLDPAVSYKIGTNKSMISFLDMLASAGLAFVSSEKKQLLMSPQFALGIATSGEIGGPLAATPEDDSADNDAEEGNIIIETNFRLYLYGKSSLLREIVLQFAKFDVEVSESLTCCRLTRSSFMDAVQRGISADQVIEFLALRAHPVMWKDAAAGGGGGVVPQSICDQLRMWEAERGRVAAARDCVVISGATEVVLRNLAILGITPVAASRTAVAMTKPDYEKMNDALRARK
jgi:hypothetical protein